jgi:ABC-type transporter Mla MlaB component
MKPRRKKSGARAAAAKKPAVASKRAKSASPRKLTRASRPAPASTKGRAATGSAREALGADCTIEHAPGIHKRLAKVLANRACVTVDLAEVRRCDTAGLQVLVAFVRERREAGREVELTDASDAFLSAAKLLGLTDMLGLKNSEAQEGHA